MLTPLKELVEQITSGKLHVHFSFTTLTTTDFGDITPVTDQARSFVMINEFAGVFFVDVLIARLAGLYPATARR
jgi:hypothetical protein